jgi:hypothetical protein
MGDARPRNVARDRGEIKGSEDDVDALLGHRSRQPAGSVDHATRPVLSGSRSEIPRSFGSENTMGAGSAEPGKAVGIISNRVQCWILVWITMVRLEQNMKIIIFISNLLFVK